MMAVSALSLSHSGTGHNVDALQYYQQAFPSLQVSLRNNDDLVSDGLFLTHFLLLIYEVRGPSCNFSQCIYLHPSGRSRRATRLEPLVSPYLPPPSHSLPSTGQVWPRAAPIYSLVGMPHRLVRPVQRSRDGGVCTGRHRPPDAPWVGISSLPFGPRGLQCYLLR